MKNLECTEIVLDYRVYSCSVHNIVSVKCHAIYMDDFLGQCEMDSFLCVSQVRIYCLYTIKLAKFYDKICENKTG